MGEKHHCQDNIIEVRRRRQPSEEVGGTKLHFLSSSLHQVTSTEFLELAKRSGKDCTFLSKGSLAACAH